MPDRDSRHLGNGLMRLLVIPVRLEGSRPLGVTRGHVASAASAVPLSIQVTVPGSRRTASSWESFVAPVSSQTDLWLHKVLTQALYFTTRLATDAGAPCWWNRNEAFQPNSPIHFWINTVNLTIEPRTCTHSKLIGTF